jgi:hypothetical protein
MDESVKRIGPGRVLAKLLNPAQICFLMIFYEEDERPDTNIFDYELHGQAADRFLWWFKESPFLTDTVAVDLHNRIVFSKSQGYGILRIIGTTNTKGENWMDLWAKIIEKRDNWIENGGIDEKYRKFLLESGKEVEEKLIRGDMSKFGEKK